MSSKISGFRPFAKEGPAALIYAKALLNKDLSVLTEALEVDVRPSPAADLLGPAYTIPQKDLDTDLNILYNLDE